MRFQIRFSLLIIFLIIICFINVIKENKEEENLDQNKLIHQDAQSAIKRAKSNECKRKIFKEAIKLANIKNKFRYYMRDERLETKCPKLIQMSRVLFRIKERDLLREINRNEMYSFKEITQHYLLNSNQYFMNRTIYLPDIFACKEICSMNSYKYAGFRQSFDYQAHNESYCVCLNEVRANFVQKYIENKKCKHSIRDQKDVYEFYDSEIAGNFFFLQMFTGLIKKKFYIIY